MRDASDEQLLGSLATDRVAFEEFYRRHVGRVQTIAVRRVGHPDQVADVISTVFLTVIESAHRFDPQRGQALPWLHGVAANVAATERRRAARHGALDARAASMRVLDSDDYADIEAQIDAAEDVRAVRAAMDEMPDDDRRLLELVIVDGMAVSDAAAVLRIRAAAARMRLTRARRRLARLLVEHGVAPQRGDPQQDHPSYDCGQEVS